MAHYHLILFLVGVSALMTAINLMEAKPVPARTTAPRRSSSSFANFHRSLFGSMDDMSAIPTMMVMPSYVYYQIMSSIHSPFHRMVKSAKWSAMKDSSEEQDDEEELDEEMEEPEEMEEDENEESEVGKKEAKKSTANNSNKDERSNKKEREKVSQTKSKKEEEIESVKDAKEPEPKVEVKEASQSVKDDKPSTEEADKKPLKEVDEDEEESVTHQSEKEENSEKESEKEKQESVTEEPENQSEKDEETVTTESPSQESTLALIIETTTEEIIERMPSAEPRIMDNDSAKDVGRPSMTYVCKYGKCQHSAEAKKLLEQEIEAELWAKF